MQIAEDKVVSFHYRLNDIDGTQLESSYEAEPTLYLHGHGNILAALEDTLLGKSVGEKISTTLSPEQAYGVYREGATQRISIKHLHEYTKLKNKLKPGAIVLVNTPKGPWEALVLKVGKFNVDIDSNHPLAGRSLVFNIEIVDVRDASADEVAHGHAHGVGGHHHD